MKNSRVIAFRLDPHFEEKLQERATLTNQSPGEVARALVRVALEQDEPALLEERLDRIEKDLRDLSGNLCVSVRALLVTLGNLPVAEVETWAKDNLR